MPRAKQEVAVQGAEAPVGGPGSSNGSTRKVPPSARSTRPGPAKEGETKMSMAKPTATKKPATGETATKAKETVAKEPVAKGPVAKGPVVKESIARETVVKDTIVKEIEAKGIEAKDTEAKAKEPRQAKAAVKHAAKDGPSGVSDGPGDEAAAEAHKPKRARPVAAKKVDGTDGTGGGTDGAVVGTDHGEPREHFLEHQRVLLMAERRNYTRQADELRAQAEALALEHEPGDVQFDEEGGEGGTANVDRELDLHLSAQAHAAIEEIDAALDKITAGTYGFCESCGSPVPKARLEALPHARLCVSCKSGGLSARRQ